MNVKASADNPHRNISAPYTSLTLKVTDETGNAERNLLTSIVTALESCRPGANKLADLSILLDKFAARERPE